jgi:hypothetical protein
MKVIRIINYILLGIIILHFCTIEDLSFYARDVGITAMGLSVPFALLVWAPLFSVSKPGRNHSKICFVLFSLYFILVGKLYKWNLFYKPFEEMPDFLKDTYSDRWMFIIALIILLINVIFAEYLGGDDDSSLYSRLKKEFPFI